MAVMEVLLLLLAGAVVKVLQGSAAEQVLQVPTVGVEVSVALAVVSCLPTADLSVGQILASEAA